MANPIFFFILNPKLQSASEQTRTCLFPLFLGRLARPEEVGADGDAAALVGFLEQLGGGQRALRPQRLVVLLREARHTLERRHDERDRRQLRLRVADLVLVDRECLRRIVNEHVTNIRQQMRHTDATPEKSHPHKCRLKYIHQFNRLYSLLIFERKSVCNDLKYI